LEAISITDHNIYPRWCVTREITGVVGGIAISYIYPPVINWVYTHLPSRGKNSKSLFIPVTL
jgi:hypothetical protein